MKKILLSGALVVLASTVLVQAVDKDLALFFANFSTKKVHALFIDEQDSAKIFEAGGWTRKSVNMMFTLMKATLPPLVEGVVVLTTGIPGTSIATGFGLQMAQRILGDFPAVVSGAITLQAIRDKDYFNQVFPLSNRYSYYPGDKKGSHAQTAFKTHFKRPGTKGSKDHVVLMVFADKNGIIDLSKLEYVGNFERTRYNAVQYGPEPGRVIYYFKNPATGAIEGTKEVGLFIPVDLDADGTVDYSPEGKSELDRLLDLQRRVKSK